MAWENGVVSTADSQTIMKGFLSRPFTALRFFRALLDTYHFVERMYISRGKRVPSNFTITWASHFYPGSESYSSSLSFPFEPAIVACLPSKLRGTSRRGRRWQEHASFSAKRCQPSDEMLNDNTIGRKTRNIKCVEKLTFIVAQIEWTRTSQELNNDGNSRLFVTTELIVGLNVRPPARSHVSFLEFG